MLQVKVEWTEQLVAKQKQITEQILKETEKIKAISDAEREKAVQEIHIQQKIEVCCLFYSSQFFHSYGVVHKWRHGLRGEEVKQQ